MSHSLLVRRGYTLVAVMPLKAGEVSRAPRPG